MARSKFLSVSQRDWIHGLILALLSAIGTFLANELSANGTIDLILLKRCGIAAAIGLISYLVKNLFTNTKGEFGKEPTPPKV